jgi:putative restriction endonuclease
VNAYLAATDNDWFRFLASREGVDEVNFWYPKPWGGRFGVLSHGQPLLFKLKRPHNHVAGGGFVAHYWQIPLSIAWDAFGEKNGAATRAEVFQRIAQLRHEALAPGYDPVIGCVILVEPFFFPRDLWIEDPPGWHPNIQRGRTYDLQQDEDGRELWRQVADRLGRMKGPRIAEPEFPLGLPGGYGSPGFQAPRLGQGAFRALITDAYGRRCAVTQERALPALEAAHIRPFSESPEHSLRNGLLLRSDVHRLFDAGYVTVTPEYRVEASPTMRADFNDGENYLKLHGQRILVPERGEWQPDPRALAWHNENRYRG